MKHAPIVLSLLALTMSCNNASDSGEESVKNETEQVTVQTENNKMDVSLFDGKSFSGWHPFNKKGTITNWRIEDSALVCLGAAPDAEGGDIVSDKEYGSFDLSWEWKMSPGGNSGLMYHVVESPEYKAPYETGPEYQMIDDIGFPSKLEDWQKSGADYAMYTPNDRKKLKPVGEWNTSRILFDNGHVEHWLNGEKILEFTAWSDDWNNRRDTGKWKDYPGYGKAKRGRIALQDHGQKVYFRKIMIRELAEN